ncbi:MAG: HEPN domain-containing protein [Deltaproteobacteria bacterium]|nr:HEPN domain-containing protein [Deltaproteobacteria bacterium]
MAIKRSTTEVPKEKFREYRNKAKQFYEVMLQCLQQNDWDAVILNGVHASISLSDAVTVFLIGKRSTGKSHQEAAYLLSQAVGQEEEGRRQANRLAQILNWKHNAEYEPTRTSEREARDFEKIVTRFIQWARSRIPE